MLWLAALLLAARPLTTDDAKVIGRARAQLETWVQVEDGRAEHWLVPALGPTDFLELAIGVVHGHDEAYSIAGPLLQAKAAVLPGLAVVGGAIAPAGFGHLDAPGWAGYGYLAGMLGERLSLLANAGVGGTAARQVLGCSAALQLRATDRLDVMAEVIRGDLYTGANHGSGQLGLRYSVGEGLQLDGTAGVGLWGNERRPVWFTVGVRVAMSWAR